MTTTLLDSVAHAAGFHDAVRTARAGLVQQMDDHEPECWSGYTIVQREDGEYRAHPDTCWDEPLDAGVNWAPPSGDWIAHVNLRGVVSA